MMTLGIAAARREGPEHKMPLIDLTLQHGQILEDASRRLAVAVK